MVENITQSVFEDNTLLTEEELKKLKGLGCLKDKRYNNVFNVRVITRNGKVTSEEAKVIADASKKYGSGEITLTSRMTFEIQCVPYKNIYPLINFLEGLGLTTGGTGPKVRPIVSCKGTTCVFGLIDTFDLSKKIHDKFYVGYHNVVLPHKFKIAVGGCPNNCVKPDLNDLGIIGQSVPEINGELCKGCKICLANKKCYFNAIKVENNKAKINYELCNNCGKCINSCHFNAINQKENGYKIYVGGRWGKKTARGIPLNKVFTSQDEVLNTIEKAILLFKNEGIQGERFAETIERLGFEYVQNKLLNE